MNKTETSSGFIPLRFRPLGPAYRWSLRAVALAGFALSAYLTWAGTAGLPGCDATSPEGCGAVISTIWGKWLGLPVSLGGAAVFLGLLLGTVGMAPRPSPTRWALLTGLGVAAFASALWFMGLMLVEVRAYCPWCLAVHACSATALALILARAPLLSARGLVASRATSLPAAPLPMLLGAMAGVAAFSVLIAGQLIGGGEFRIEFVKTAPPTIAAAPGTQNPPGAMPPARESDALPAEAVPSLPHPTEPGAPAPSGRSVTLLGGRLAMTLGEYPILGDPEAEHVLGLITDPTCPACRKMHGDLVDAMEHFDGRFAVVTFPMALDAQCNPRMTRTSYGHRNACLFGTMSLAIWNTDRAAFRAFDDALFRGMMAPEAEDAMAWAGDLLGEERLAAALNDPLYEKMLNFSISLFYSPLVDEKLLPVLLGPGEARLGNPESVEELRAWIAAQFGWENTSTQEGELSPVLKHADAATTASNSLE